jgi:hypothetical protein
VIDEILKMIDKMTKMIDKAVKGIDISLSTLFIFTTRCLPTKFVRNNMKKALCTPYARGSTI